jgi:hypothetical protein
MPQQPQAQPSLERKGLGPLQRQAQHPSNWLAPSEAKLDSVSKCYID